MVKALLKNKISIVGLTLTVLLLVVAASAPWIAPYDPFEQSISNRLASPSQRYPLGTDRLGRDVLSRIVYASRISIGIGFGSALLGAVIGTLVGALATFKGGLIESLMLHIIDIMMSFPTLILCLLLLTMLGGSLVAVMVAIGMAFVPRFARLSRGPTLALRETEFVEASRAIGTSLPRIVIRHILPNIIGPINVMAVLWIATAIRIEATLSFLGFGVRPPTPTWGNMLQEGFRCLSYAPTLSLFPGLALCLAILGFNLLGDGLRDILDPKMRLQI